MSRRYISNKCPRPLLGKCKSKSQRCTNQTHTMINTNQKGCYSSYSYNQKLVSINWKRGRTYLGSPFEGVHSPSWGRHDGRSSCASRNRLLAHIDTDQETQLRQWAGLGYKAQPLPMPQAWAPLSTNSTGHQLGTKWSTTRTCVTTVYICTIIFWSWSPQAQSHGKMLLLSI